MALFYLPIAAEAIFVSIFKSVIGHQFFKLNFDLPSLGMHVTKPCLWEVDKISQAS
jgi:hypothetical protein